CCSTADCPAGQTCTEPAPPAARAAARPGRCVVPCSPERRCGTAADPVCCGASEVCVGSGDARACCPYARRCGGPAPEATICCGADQACVGIPPDQRCAYGKG
ncbi:MAG: hypothetical protein AVDCRST_MAG59-4960, partial [uncultured Thermomicrobiales bacterium]